MMAEALPCKICNMRRAKRACPAVGGDICAICCGREREATLSCPLECDYLQDAHQREKPVRIPDSELSNPDVKVNEEFVAAHEELVLFAIYSLLQATLRTPGAVDRDVIDALATLIQSHRTLESGLIYEAYSPNPIAASIQRGFSTSLADYQRLRQEREALSPVRNTEILSTLVFLHRVGQQNLNGRPRGRMFIDLLRHMTPDTPVSEPRSGLII